MGVKLGLSHWGKT